MTENGVRFGEVLPIDQTRRIVTPKGDVTAINPEAPSYTRFARGQVRGMLLDNLAKEGWPPTPEISTVEDLFDGAKEAVATRWNHVLGNDEQRDGGENEGVLPRMCREWASQMPNPEEHAQIVSILTNPSVLETKLKMRQLGALEPLRNLVPEAWRSLLVLSSERQLTELILARHWLSQLPESTFAAMGMTKTELRLFTDIAGVVGKYVDEAFVKQLELADVPGGSAPSKLAMRGIEGGEYVYDSYIPGSNRTQKLNFVDVFPYEFPAITGRLHALAKRTNTLLHNNQLPATYRLLPKFLHQVARRYGAKDKKISRISKKWDDLYKAETLLAESGCPIIISPQGATGVTGDAGKADVELRVSLRTKQTMKFEPDCDAFRPIAQSLLDDYRPVMSASHRIPPVILSYQPFAFGSDLVAHTRAEADEGGISGHVNAIQDTAVYSELPLLKKVFPNLVLPNDTYAPLSVRENMLHELGHLIFPENDEVVGQRIGDTSESEVIEENKAEMGAMKLLWKGIQNGLITPDEASHQFSASMGEALDYLANKSSEPASSGERYFLAGHAQFDRLLTRGLMIRVNGHYDILNQLGAIEALAQFGDEILAIYSNPATTPHDVNTYVGRLRARMNDPRLKEFLDVVKG